MKVNATRYPYDLTNITNSDNILEFIQEVNILSGEWFMTGMLFAGWVILFTSMRGAGNKEALLASSFIIAVMSVFFRTLDFISTTKVIVIMIIFVLIFAVSSFTKDA